MSNLLKKTSQSLILKILGFICSYLFTILITNSFGVAAQGTVTLMFAIMGLLSMFFLKGANIYLTKVIAKSTNLLYSSRIYWNLFYYFLSLSLLIMPVIYLLNIYFSEEENESLNIIINIINIIFFPSLLISLNAAFLRGVNKTNLYTAITGNIGKFFIPLILLSALSVLHYKNKYLPLYIVAFSTILLSIFSMFFVWNELNRKIMFFSLKKVKKDILSFFSKSYPMMLNSMAFFILGWIDTFIIGLYFGEIELGYYSVALKLSLGVGFTHSALSTVIAPIIANLWRKRNYAELQKQINISTKYIFISSLFIIVSLIVFSEMIMGFFGNDFSNYSNYLIVLCIGQFFTAISGPVGVFLDMTGYQKKFTKFLTIACIFNILSNILLVRPIGVLGVCISTSLSYLIWNFLSVFFVYKRLKVRTFIDFKNLFKIIVIK